MKLPARCSWSERMDLLEDDECPADERRALERHRDQCARCARVCRISRALADSLRPPPVAQASSDLRDRIQAISRSRTGSLSAWLGWAVAALVTAAWIGSGFVQRPAAMVPMVQTAVADYRMHMRAELPAPQLAALEQVIGMPLPILPPARATLVATWVVPMRGTLAAALAYRVDHHIVVQYVVRRSLFFRQPQVRRAVRHGGLYRAQAGPIAVIAWPGAHSGRLMVGRVPARVLRTLKM